MFSDLHLPCAAQCSHFGVRSGGLLSACLLVGYDGMLGVLLQQSAWLTLGLDWWRSRTTVLQLGLQHREWNLWDEQRRELRDQRDVAAQLRWG
jgi:hypothetical protein